MSKSIKITFGLLCFSFVAIISSFFLPLERSPLKGPLFMIFLFTPLPLGIIFLFQLKKTKLKAELKKVLKITALSALALPLGSLLHNLFYALAIVSKNILDKPPNFFYTRIGTISSRVLVKDLKAVKGR